MLSRDLLLALRTSGIIVSFFFHLPIPQKGTEEWKGIGWPFQRPWVAVRQTRVIALIIFNNLKQGEISPPETKVANCWKDVSENSVMSKVLPHDLKFLLRKPGS